MYTLKKVVQKISWNYSRVANTGDYRTKFCKIYGTYQDKMRNFHEKISEFSIFSPEELRKFYRTLFYNRLYPRPLNSSIKFIEPFFSVYLQYTSFTYNIQNIKIFKNRLGDNDQHTDKN